MELQEVFKDMAQCLSPFEVRQDDKVIPVPCGRCTACYARRISGWSFRLMQLDKISSSSTFITLTYDSDNVPITRNGFMSLKRRDIQLFFKRLRKAHGNRSGANVGSIKYYVAGEYGGKTFRPHYHILIFNSLVELIEPAWQLGHVHFGKVSGASVGYTLKYMSKTKRIPLHRNDDRVPEFSLMSKGIGLNYIDEKVIKWHKEDLLNRMYCLVEGGKKIAMPRYLKDKIYSYQERSEIAGYQKGEMEKKAMENPVTLKQLKDRKDADQRKIFKNAGNRNKI